jgi:hypothetical protein
MLKTWAGNYKALVNGTDVDQVCGWAYQVESREDEDILRYYETENYEVVRCDIQLQDGKGLIHGLHFASG